VAAGLIGCVPRAGHAQGVANEYSYVTPPLTVIQRNQQNQLDANRAAITKEGQGRFQNQLDLERQTYEEARRERDGYLFQDNTSQRSLETQLREQDLRLRQQDQDNRARAIRQRLEEEQNENQARQGLGSSSAQ
jgi:hypothetical protein